MLQIHTGPGDVSYGSISLAATTTAYLDSPTNSKVGEDIVAVVASSTTTPFGVSAGWSLISRPKSEAHANARNVAVYRYRVGATGVPTGSTFTAQAASAARVAVVAFRVTGADSLAFTAGVATWPVADPNTSTATVLLPEFTQTDPGAVTIAGVYSNISAGLPLPVPTITGMTLIGRSVSTVGASTTVDVFRGTGSIARTVTWSPTASNSYGLQLALKPEPSGPAPTWEAKVFTNGALQSATVAAVKVGTQFVAPTQVSWAVREYTISDLFSTAPYYLAHRGSGDNWPEHTMESYTNAAAYGIKALELSVNKSMDGVLFCHHDQDGAKMTGSTAAWSTMNWAAIQALWNDSSEWTGTSTPRARIPLLKDVLDAYAATHVIFIEDKQGTSTTQLLDMMDTYPNSTNHFVWKKYADSTASADAARARGYTTWGYFMSGNFENTAALHPHFDYLGVPHTASDAVIASIVAIGKPVICWEIHYRHMRDRVLALGVKGMMTSNTPYIHATSVAEHTRDKFNTGLRTAGDMPHSTSAGWGVQPVIDKANAVLRFAMAASVGYVMGSMCPVEPAEYAYEYEMRYPTILPDSTQHAGGYACRTDDRPHKAGLSLPTGGYHFLIRDTGRIDLYRHDAGSGAGIPLSQQPSPPPVAGQWMKFRVEVRKTAISLTRLDVTPAVTASTNDSTYRGGYVGLSKNYATTTGAPAVPVEFRNVKILPL